jgi:glycosyltransferase involved in cell wall biosynthesis
MSEPAIHKIKLLIFIPGLQCGGTEKYVSLLCNHINTAQFDVSLVVLNNSRQFYPITNPAITIIDLQEKKVSRSFLKIKRVIKKIQPDVIYSNANHLNLFFAIFKKSLARKAVLIARESSIVSINSKRAKNKWLYNWLLQTFYKRIDGIICQSKYMQQDLINNYNIAPQKTVLIYNAVEATAAAAVAAQQNKLITVCRLSSEKGTARLLYALAKLDIPFHFYIVGNGNQQEQLQQLVNQLQLQDKVVFTGERKVPFEGMEDAQLFLTGSYYEGFPNALLEAAALGIPAIAFDVPGGIPEIIRTAQNGTLVKDNDIIAFAAAIEKAVQFNFNRQQLKEITSHDFSPVKIIAATENFFTTILHKTSFSK